MNSDHPIFPQVSQDPMGLIWPKTGSNRAQNTAKNVGDFSFFVVFDIIMEVLRDFNYSKWLILTPAHIAILFGTFLELPEKQLNLHPWTLYLSQTYCKTYKTNMDTPLENNIFISENLKLWKVWKVCAPSFWVFENVFFLQF